MREGTGVSLMADPKAPEMGDADRFVRFDGCIRSPVSLSEIRDKLQRFFGLAIVSEADKRVLEACAAFTDKDLSYDPPTSSADRKRLEELSETWRRAVLAARSGA